MENLTAMADTDRLHRSVVRSRDAVPEIEDEV